MMLVTLREPIVRASGPDPEERDPEAAYRSAIAAGWPEDAAAAWAAWTIRLKTATEGQQIRWSIRDVRQLQFLKHAYDSGRIPGDDEAES